jgi:PIN domain nuclease of toxin-antitoxin system
MKALLDTHAFIWWTIAPVRLGSQASRLCFDSANQLVLSVASVWEMQIKAMLGKLTLHKPLRQMIADQVQQNGLEVLPVNLEHVLRLDSLASLHKDPFDRLLVVQALVEDCSIVTHDQAIAQYPVPVIW